MKILMITENDPAGMAIAFTKAINTYTPHSCRLITTKIRYNFEFEKDLHVPDLDAKGFDEIRDLLRQTDVIQFHMGADENLELGPIQIKDYIKGKVLIHHHHGHPHFRAHPDLYRKRYRRLKRRSIVSTPDLLKLLPAAIWLPNIVPVYDSLYMPRPVSENGYVLVGQSATRKDLKNTEELIEVVQELQKDSSAPALKLDVIENTEHKECLRLKGFCHIIFDHMQGYYGVSSLESLSQGKPVIAGLDNWNIKHIKKFAGTDRLPWIITRNKSELKLALDQLRHEPDLRRELGAYSRKFMEECWSEQRVLERLLDFYESL
jgi:glycosyltransferase involved in cell wall biosynthesis